MRTLTLNSHSINMTGLQCSGLSAAVGANSTSDCQAAACAQGEPLWQFCAGPVGTGSRCGRANCWVGSSSDCNNNNAWVSSGRNGSGPDPIDPAPTKVDYDDSAWAVIDAPYDLLIGTPYNESYNNGQASIGKNVTWARKHFMLPADWRDFHVEVCACE